MSTHLPRHPSSLKKRKKQQYFGFLRVSEAKSHPQTPNSNLQAPDFPQKIRILGPKSFDHEKSYRYRRHLL
jgi:hypothetical protein